MINAPLRPRRRSRRHSVPWPSGALQRISLKPGEQGPLIRFQKAEALQQKGRLRVAIAITVFVNLFLIWMSLGPIQKLCKWAEFDPVKIQPMELTVMPPSSAEKFVETNVAANEEEPAPETAAFSSQNQRAAQEKIEPDAKPGDRPTTVSDNADAHKVVEASPDQVAQTPPEVFEEESQDDALEQTEPEPEHKVEEATQEKSMEKPMDKDGLLAYLQEGSELDSEEPVEGAEPTPQVTVAQAGKRSHPRPRPQVITTGVTGPLRSYKGSAGQVGLRAVDARFSQYGAYLQRMYEAICSQWIQLATQSRSTLTDRQTFVDVSFVIDQKGAILRTTINRTNASQTAQVLCRDAIQSRAPFGIWSESMAKTLGTEQTINIRFNYI
jgi:hypothetical protein